MAQRRGVTRRGRRNALAKGHADKRRALRRRLEREGLFPSDVEAAVAELRERQRAGRAVAPRSAGGGS